MAPAHSDPDARFVALQRRLRQLDEELAPGRPPHTVVAIPSLNVDTATLEDLGGEAIAAFEERFLYLLLLLRRPHVRLVLVTSRPVPAAMIDYYLGLLAPDAEAADLRARLVMMSAQDDSPAPLAAKLFARPRLVEEIRAQVADFERAFIAPFNVTDAERDLALALDLPVYGPDQRFFWLGTKRGGRELFAAEGVAHPAGRAPVGDAEEVARAIVDLRAATPGLESVVVKLNEGVYGQGNAVVQLAGLPAPGDEEEVDAVRERVEELGEDYLDRLARDPGIVEQMIAAPGLRSPSVQMRILAGGEPGVVATHDQLLGGPHGQTFVGCTFPAEPGYALAIAREAAKVRDRLVREGVVGRFGVDFVVGQDGAGGWDVYAVEINLREGGTTHPFGTLWLLAGGGYDPGSGTYTSASGRPKCYAATDDLESPSWVGLGVEELIAASAARGLTYDSERETGVVFHLLRTLPSQGRLGMTAIGETREQTQELYGRAVALLDELAA